MLNSDDDDILDFGEELDEDTPPQPVDMLAEIHDPVTSPFENPLEAKGEIMKYGRDIISIHRKVAMGLLPDFRGDRQLLNAQFKAVMDIDPDDWALTMPPELLKVIKKEGKLTQDKLTEIFVAVLSGKHTLKQAESLLGNAANMLRFNSLKSILDELTIARARAIQGSTGRR